MIPNRYTIDTALSYVAYILPLQVDQKLCLFGGHVGESLLSSPPSLPSLIPSLPPSVPFIYSIVTFNGAVL